MNRKTNLLELTVNKSTMGKQKDKDNMEPGAIALKIGIEIAKRTIPSGIAWASTYVRGNNILLVGPSNSGKTKFSDYMIYGLLMPASRHITTVEEVKSPTFEIDVGSNATLKLRVRKSLDQPGQNGPIAHANLVKEKRPHGLLMILDASQKMNDTNKWVKEFCLNLDRVLREAPTAQKKLKSIVVCMNKRDLVTNANHMQSRIDGVHSTLVGGLSAVLGKQRASEIPVLPCVSVLKEEYGSTLADTLIATIAKELS